jgi:hypothetical protein
MGLFFDISEYSQLGDTVGNDGTASFIGAVGSEWVGAITSAVAKYSPGLAESLLTTKNDLAIAAARYGLVGNRGNRGQIPILLAAVANSL